MSQHPLFPLPLEITRVVLGGGSFIDQEGLNLPRGPQPGISP